MRAVLLSTMGAITLGLPAASQAESKANSFTLTIPAAPLGDALNEFAQQTGMQVLFSSQLVAQLRGPRVTGSHTAEEALGQLLVNTGLKFEFVNPRTITIVSVVSPPNPPARLDAAVEEVKSTEKIEVEDTPAENPKTTGTNNTNAARGDNSVKHSSFFSRLAAFLGVCASASISSTACAQGAANEPLQLEEVVVTGSRLQSAGFNAPTPVTVINAETIEQRAPANMSDVLLEQPALRINSGDSLRIGIGGNNPNPLPQSFIVAPDLRSLGANRTLVLMNGHRVVPSTWDSQVDINIVPVGLVERVEVVTGGASAAYGSDAVSGVTNIILRKNMQGIKGGAQLGVTEYTGAKQYTFNLSGGTSLMNDRLHVMAGVDVNKSEAITDVYGKKYGQDEIGTFGPTAAYRIANNAQANIITTNVEPASTAPGGLYCVGAGNNPCATQGPAYTFDANGNPVAFSRGTISQNGQLMIGSTSNYGRNLNNLQPLRIPTSRYDFMGRVSYDITDDMNVYFEFNNSRNLTYPYKAGDNYQSGSIGGNTPGIVVARTNPFVTANTASLLTSVGHTGTTFTIGRNHTELSFGGISGLAARQDAETRRFAVGLEGSFGDNWNYDLFFQQGRAWTLLQRNDYSPWALQKAVNGCATPAVGSPGFTTAAQVATLNLYESLSGKTCVPFNPFGVDRNTAAAIEYFQNQTYSDQHMSQDAASVSLTGTPFQIPAGDVAVAVGADWRQDSVNAPVDPISRAGSGYGAAVPAPLSNTVAETFGHYHVQEGFLELGIPLLKDKFLARSLDFNSAGRITRYELTGTVYTWKLGMTWEPIESLRLRLTKSHDIRQGNMVELFRVGGPNNSNYNTTQLKVGTVGANGTAYNPSGNTNPVGSVANGPGYGAAVGGGLSVGGVGNPLLRPEIADTVTGGVVFTKGGFQTSVDYYYINMTDVIANGNAQTAIDNCVAGDAKYCSYITFITNANVASGIQIIGAPNENQNRLVVSGYDFELGYNLQIGPGRFSARSLINYQPQNKQVTLSNGQTTERANTLGSQPKLGYNLSFGYDVGRLNANLQVRGFGKRRGNNIIYNPDGSINANTILGPEDGDAYTARVASAAAAGGAAAGTVAASTNTINKNRWPAQYFINGGLSFDVNDKVTAYLNVDNLLNKQPPELATSAALYDFVGRRYRMGARANF
jgi:outer membrane receptor for ferrienterochelin and colicin